MNESLSPRKITARNHRKGVQLKVGVEVEVKEKKKKRKTVGDRIAPARRHLEQSAEIDSGELEKCPRWTQKCRIICILHSDPH